MVPSFSREQLYYAKVVIIMTAVFFLFLKSEQHFNYPFLILALLGGGYYLGKITCSVHLKNTGIGLTLLVFIGMNLVHSFIDGISFAGQPFFYWISAIGGHELIRQPTLYIILWAMLQPISGNNYLKGLICFLSVTMVWVLGIGLGKVSGATIMHAYHAGEWLGYSIFLFTGDIAHHLLDQYYLLQQKK